MRSDQRALEVASSSEPKARSRDERNRKIELFDSSEHEPITDVEWDEDIAREFIARWVRDADEAYDPGNGWPLHPEDQYDDQREPYQTLYCGAAGTLFAFAKLAQRYDIPVRLDPVEAIVRCDRRYTENPAESQGLKPSYFIGRAGILTVWYALTRDATLLDRIGAELSSNAGNPSCEPLWGSPGTAIAALLVRELDGDMRFDGILRNVHDELWSTWRAADEPGGLLWEQDLSGQRCCYVGAGHGALGNLVPFLRVPSLVAPERMAVVCERIPALLEKYILRDGPAANWVSIGEPFKSNRVQWCHGAPGIITSLAALPATDPRVESLLGAGGEGIWRAGPIRKGPTLCHGTAGNGFAFLRLAQRTGDAVWTHRARRFAMHAIEQAHRWRETFGMRSFSLWTGDAGVALYLDAVLRNDPAIPLLDAT